jgi:hypothetical protein
MSETPARKPRPRRTFSAFGGVRKMPSEYEIVTHKQNWTLRANRAAAFEQNPSSAPNLWFLTYRDNSPLQAGCRRVTGTGTGIRTRSRTRPTSGCSPRQRPGSRGCCRRMRTRAREVIDRGAYVRVQGEDRITVTEETLRRYL